MYLFFSMCMAMFYGNVSLQVPPRVRTCYSVNGIKPKHITSWMPNINHCMGAAACEHHALGSNNMFKAIWLCSSKLLGYRSIAWASPSHFKGWWQQPKLSMFEGRLAELLRFWCCQLRKSRKSCRKTPVQPPFGPSVDFSAICDSQQPISPIGFLCLKLPPPPCAVLVGIAFIFIFPFAYIQVGYVLLRMLSLPPGSVDNMCPCQVWQSRL